MRTQHNPTPSVATTGESAVTTLFSVEKAHVAETVTSCASDVLSRRRKKSEIEDLGGGVSRVELNGGRFTLIDSEDADRVRGLKWTAGPRGYARCKRLGIYLHRFITGAPAGMVVDHINWDGLDNRKANLRVCSQRENSNNRDPRKIGSHRFMKEVFRRKPWQARYAGRHIGAFTTEAEALEAIRIKQESELRRIEAERALEATPDIPRTLAHRRDCR